MTEEPEFGTSGLRGLADALTDDLVARYAAAFTRSFGNNGTVYLGQDKRASSPRIAAAVARGIASEGCLAVDCGVLPTPALAMAAMGQGTSSIMVTGSHIPADRNGLKFYRADGEIDKEDEARLTAAVADMPPPGPGPASTLQGDAAQLYVGRYRDFFGKRALSGLRIGFWAHSSAAADVLPAVLDAMGAETVVLGKSAEFVSVDTEAIDQSVRARLADWARTHMLDALVSTDGDADRPLFADAEGVVIPGDVLGPITARLLEATHVVTTVSANTMVERMDAFDHVARTRIGSPYVIAEMARHAGKRVVGYEPNGGFLLGFEAASGKSRLSPLMTRDSLLPIVAALVASQAAGGTAKLIKALPRRRTATDRIKDVPREIGRGMAEALIAGDMSILPDGLGDLVATDTTDGARLTFAGGEIVTVRPSGNAPELRVYVEADSGKTARYLLDEVFEKIRARL
ncbi:phosphohexomutase domain-containing protein [Kangsaoukella pontilimi]|uniref:phosphomannomutase n=1 Tax=Kangsaoukella pontilimi TaxID=2691042 RepID=UPI001D09E0BE|nr:phosphomannomutase [Kangsaoukella pontilimi]